MPMGKRYGVGYGYKLPGAVNLREQAHAGRMPGGPVSAGGAGMMGRMDGNKKPMAASGRRTASNPAYVTETAKTALIT